MEGQITNYQCPTCTGPLKFDGGTGKLVCEYCGSSFTVEEVEKLFAGKNKKANETTQKAEKKQEQKKTEKKAEAAPENDQWDASEVNAYQCPSCGAELICDVTTAATSCPYCGNPTIVPGKLSGARKPDAIIPFKLDKKAAVEALKKHYKGKPLLPSAFAKENHLEEVKGVYVPFWLYDTKVNADLTFAATRSHVHSTKEEIITETDHYAVQRSGSVRFSGIPVDGSEKMPDAHMDAIEPFDYGDLKPFSLSYLPGFLADKYDVDKDTCFKRAKQRSENSAEEAVRNTVTGYDTCTKTQGSTNVAIEKVRYALMPVWLLSTQWNGNNYLFAMNGQTGRLIGDLPTDKKKLALWCVGAFAVATAALGWIFL